MALGNPADKAEGSESPSGAMAGPKTRGKDLANIHFFTSFLIKKPHRIDAGATKITPNVEAFLGQVLCKHGQLSLQSDDEAKNGSISAIELGLWSSEAHSARR